MRAAISLLLLAAALGGCGRKADSGVDNMAIGNDAATPPQIEALPPDESSATPSDQLANGADNADVDAITNNSD